MNEDRNQCYANIFSLFPRFFNLLIHFDLSSFDLCLLKNY